MYKSFKGEIKMLLIYNDNTNPYFNLAMEEYLLKTTTEDLFILWRNKPSIIVGKNQNTLSEINLDYVNENSIPVVRRQSGGGAVFHDLGNLNFTPSLGSKSECSLVESIAISNCSFSPFLALISAFLIGPKSFNNTVVTTINTNINCYIFLKSFYLLSSNKEIF